MRYFRHILILSLTLLIGGIFTVSRAQSLFNHQINYQGKLTNASGVPVADGTYNIAFRLYTTASSATTTNIWEELDTTTSKVQVTGGLFSILLGSTTPLTNVNFNQTLYLGVEIGSTTTPPTWDGEMTPRKKLGAVPAAFEAEKFGGFATTSFLRSDAINSTTTASNWLTFTNNGTGNIAVFTGSGNVGIGTTSPYAKLSIHANSGETNSTLFAVSSSTASATSSIFTILNSGNVGIGTSSPTAKLNIDNTAVPIGAELITNGTFTGSAAGWGLGSDVAYSNNHIVSTYAGGDPTASTTFASVAGNTYLLTFTVFSGNAPMYFYFDNNTTPLNSGPFSTTATTTIKVGFQATYTGTDTIWFDDFNYVTSDTWTLDDVSIKQIAPPSSALKVVGFDGAPWLSLGGDILGNTALGGSAFTSNTTGKGNTANGYFALNKNTTGSYNIGNGYQALALNTTGDNNTANGFIALFNNTTGSNNTANGYVALNKNTTGTDNTANGYRTLYKNTTGIQNTAVGSNALINNTTGTNNTANGQAALSANITGIQNTANGSSALLSNTFGKGNTANGYLALRLNTTGVYNIGMGFQSGFNVTSGYDNIFLGHDENTGGTAITTGFNNIGMGYNIKFPSSASSNMLNIGNFLFANLPATTTNTLLTTQPLTGKLGVGTSSPYAKLTVWGGGTDGAKVLEIANSASTTLMSMLENGTGYFLGNVGIGTTSPYAKLSIHANPAETNTTLFAVSSSTASATSSLFTILNSGNVGIGNAVPTAKLDITGVNSDAVLGAEMMATSSDRDFSADNGVWTGTNWSIGSGVITHTAGANVLTLNNIALTSAPVAGKTYQVTFTTNTTVAGTITPNIGGTNGVTVGQATGSDTQTQVMVAINANALTFTPSAAWTGTIDNVSVKEITPSSATQIVRNSNGTIGLEIRSGGSGFSNTFVGIDAGRANTTGSSNTANSYQALFSNTTGSNNTANGFQALFSNTTGSFNTANGLQALFFNTTGSFNTAIGSAVLQANTTGSFNTANGLNALPSNTTGSFNIANGYQAGYDVTTGYDNIFLGHDENTGGTAITTGFNNIGMGYNIKFPSSASSNMLNIGNFLFANLPATTTNTLLTTQPLTGKLGVGTSSPYAKLTVWGGGTDGAKVLEIANSASTTLMSMLENGTGYFLGNVGIGTTSPYAKLSIVGEAVAQMFTATSTTATSTFAGGFKVANGAFYHDVGGGFTSIDNLKMGATHFEDNAGLVSWMNMQVTSAVPSGTKESYAAYLDDNEMLTLYGEANGSGDIINYGVGIGSSTPFAKLSVSGTVGSARPIFNIASSSGQEYLRVTSLGNFGMGTATPAWLMQLVSSTSPQIALTDPNAGANKKHWTLRSLAGSLLFATSTDAYMTSSTSALTVNTNGYLGIATTSPWAALSVNGTVAMNALGTAQGNAICVTAGGEITNPGAATCTGSSERFKENIETLAPGYALDELSKLRAVSFDYKDGFYSPEDLKGSYGMIAEEVEKIDPKLVDYGYDKKPMTLKFEKFTGLLVQAAVELSDAFKALVARVTGLEDKLNTQQAEIDALKSRMNALDGQTAAAVAPTPPPVIEPAAEPELTPVVDPTPEAPNPIPTPEPASSP